MKQTKFFMMAAAAALFAACSSESDSIIADAQLATAQTEQVAVSFDSYINRGTTRAGAVGDITTDYMKNTSYVTSAGKAGFGVFGYYTNADTYDQNFTPNFMYNQQVKWDGSKFAYSPIKYWPNEFGSYAASDDIDKVSFFAYAPFVTVEPTTGKVKDNSTKTYALDNGDTSYGIVGMKRNNATGDPMIKYISNLYTDQQVDLLWGTAPQTTWNWKNTVGTMDQSIAAGNPWLNIQHPVVTSTSWDAAQKVTFDFKHSLARLNVTVDTKADDTDAADVEEPANTKVYIRSVTFEGFDTKGALNLNNTTAGIALWYNFDCVDELPLAVGNEVIVKDGRRDGKEGINPDTKEYAAINPNFVQSTVWDDGDAKPGVTGDAGNLFCKADGTEAAAPTNPLYVIPNGDPLKVTIEYDVLTADANLAGKLNDGKTNGSVVKNVITRYITIGSSATGSPSKPGTFGVAEGNGIKLANGKQYTISLHLGLNSVQFNASVTPWDPHTGGADLPHNN